MYNFIDMININSGDDIMKKILPLLILFFTFGCSLTNTPSSKVEELLAKYQMLDRDISSEIDIIIDKENLNDNQKEKYKQLIEKQYKNLSYEIKDEKIDGDTSTITVQIKVYDYKKTINELNDEYSDKDYTLEEYNDEKIKRLENTNDTVTYTLELDVLKDKDGNWKLESLSNIDKKKLQGMY